jgi:single-stranded-DNA-specific exonuclease
MAFVRACGGHVFASVSDDAAHLVRARQALRNAAAVVPHTDADGLAAGAIALRERGEGADAAVLLEPGTTPWTPGTSLPEGPLAILDWGMRELDRPALVVDHQAPEAAPRADQVFVNGYGAVPEPPTAVLMRRIVTDSPPWLAAVGAVSDLGEEGFELPEAAEARRRAVRRLTSLVNAPRRVPGGPVRDALALLVESDDPRGALEDDRVADLEEAKRESKAELDRVIGTPPVIGEATALVRFSSRCRVHPMVATTWARRLAPRVVIAANDGYLPGRVSFAMRGGDGSLLALLRSALPDDARGEVTLGHDHATGGSLAPEDFERLLEALGAPSEDA